MIVRQRMTVAEYLALPEEKPYLEYVHGEVVAKPMPSKDHSGLAFEIGGFLRDYRRVHGGFGGVESRSEFPDHRDHRFLLPDVSFWRDASAVGEGSRMNPPTLAVEIRSPEQSRASLRTRAAYLLGHGVETVWLVDPEARAAEVHERDAAPVTLPADGELTSAALPGLAVPLAELWAVLG
ncbi:MAG: Uma2 family endonuclease [Dehalococcoidia bacterium]|nr:Uma2 family endonuclease [Dehalococcoidia bacterium]